MPLTHFKDYEVLRLISKSPQSEVYLAIQNEKKIALKLYKPGFKPISDFSAKLNNPYLLPSLSNGFHEKHFFEIFEWFESQTLESQTTYNIKIQLNITAQILQGLNYLHDQGLVHADIKNSNVLLDANQQIKIIDIGVEKGIIKKSGSWFAYDDTKLGQGRDSVKAIFAENPDLAQEIEDKIIAVLKEEADNA